MIGVRDYKLIYILYRVFGSKLINPIVQPHVDPLVVEPAMLEGDSHVREEPKPLGKRMLREMRDLAEAANRDGNILFQLLGVFMVYPLVI